MTQGNDADQSDMAGPESSAEPSSRSIGHGGTGRWRLGGISTRIERDAWLRCGVFDAHRAGLLRSAGVQPSDLEGLVDAEGRSVGQEFALGRIGCAEVLEQIKARRRLSEPEAERDAS